MAPHSEEAILRWKRISKQLKISWTPAPKTIATPPQKKKIFSSSLTPTSSLFPPALEYAFPASFILPFLLPAVLSPWCTWAPSQHHLINFLLHLPRNSLKRYPQIWVSLARPSSAILPLQRLSGLCGIYRMHWNTLHLSDPQGSPEASEVIRKMSYKIWEGEHLRGTPRWI